MSKKQPHTFKQLPPPQTFKVFSITQPESQFISQHWKHLFTAIQWSIEQEESRVLCVIYKCKAQIGLLTFQESCLLYQRKFKIFYGQTQQITCIKAFPLAIKLADKKVKELIILIGFFDGNVDIYHMVISMKNVSLKKIFTISCDNKEPVTNILVYKGHILTSRLHQVQVYQDILPAVANLIITDSDDNKMAKQNQYDIVSKNIPTKNMSMGMTLSMSLGKNALHVFNESEGSRSFLLQNYQQYGTILDSMTFLLQLLEQNIVIGDTNDKLKLIYKKRKYVQRYSGFKNYCSDAYYRLFQESEQLWIGDLNGCLTYLQRAIDLDAEIEPKSSVKMVDIQIRFSKKICQNGIKKIMVCGKIMIIHDTESNIHIFDVIRDDKNSNSKEFDIQSFEEYSSDL